MHNPVQISTSAQIFAVVYRASPWTLSFGLVFRHLYCTQLNVQRYSPRRSSDSKDLTCWWGRQLTCATVSTTAGIVVGCTR